MKDQTKPEFIYPIIRRPDRPERAWGVRVIHVRPGANLVVGEVQFWPGLHWTTQEAYRVADKLVRSYLRKINT